MNTPIRLGLNVDHIATLRNARDVAYPDPVSVALLAQEYGVDGITVHLREDRRHIRDDDVTRLASCLTVPLNLEIAATSEMQTIALEVAPHAVCLVPERREERTTEGGLDVVGQESMLRDFIAPMLDRKIRVSLFVEPDLEQVDAAVRTGVPVIELHTGAYANAAQLGDPKSRNILDNITRAAAIGHEAGLEIHAGHGLTVDNIPPLVVIPELVELNIGYAIIADAIPYGLREAISRFRRAMDR